MKNQNFAPSTHALNVQPVSKTSVMLIIFLFLACLAIASSPSAQAANLVQNGGFETTTNGACAFDHCTDAPPWVSHGYAFIFAPGTADTTGSLFVVGLPPMAMWGPHNGSNNGLPATSPAGGNFVAADGAFAVSPIHQDIAGLTKDANYKVSFWWAGAQQASFYGANTEQWLVSLGNQTQATAVVNNASQGFTGWMHETFTFTADGTSDVLSFVAVGTPNGVPPFVLLDGVSVEPVATPEPGTLALLGTGVFGLGGMLRRRLRG